jgi:hypothetical protein
MIERDDDGSGPGACRGRSSGATAAPIANAISMSPGSDEPAVTEERTPRGRETFDLADASHDERIAFSVCVHRLAALNRSGSQIVRRPSTIAPSRTVISSNTWVTPPVGSGVAGAPSAGGS